MSSVPFCPQLHLWTPWDKELMWSEVSSCFNTLFLNVKCKESKLQVKYSCCGNLASPTLICLVPWRGPSSLSNIKIRIRPLHLCAHLHPDFKHISNVTKWESGRDMGDIHIFVNLVPSFLLCHLPELEMQLAVRGQCTATLGKDFCFLLF